MKKNRQDWERFEDINLVGFEKKRRECTANERMDGKDSVRREIDENYLHPL